MHAPCTDCPVRQEWRLREQACDWSLWLTAACPRACRVHKGSAAHLALLLDAATQVGQALVQMHALNCAHLDVKVAARPAALPEQL